MPDFDFREIFQVLSEVVGELADASKLPDSDDNGLQFYRHDNGNGMSFRLVTMDSIDITVSLDRKQLTLLAANPNQEVANIALGVAQAISDKRRDRHEKGETTILIPTQSQLNKAIEDTKHASRPTK